QHNKEIVEEFFTYVNTFYKSRRDLIIIVLYNKQDLPEIYPAKFLATELKLTGFPSYETCALTGHNLKPAFLRMVKRCLKRLDKLSLHNG
ncbi:MAG: GTPase domain-containing protein, partial [candidate division KSB1 bacterium]|nr:GTPase domain-containing protein [candidate division KSB1 bacterium]